MKRWTHVGGFESPTPEGEYVLYSDLAASAEGGADRFEVTEGAVSGLKSRAESAEALLAEARGWLRHTESCKENIDEYGIWQWCTCGLDALLARIPEVKS